MRLVKKYNTQLKSIKRLSFFLMCFSFVITHLSDSFFYKKNKTSPRGAFIELNKLVSHSTNESGQNLAIQIISGNIFEDINYGGGDGRNYNNADASAQSSGWNVGNIGVENARVELYDAAGDLFRVTNTDANGNYSFINLLAGDYFVRVVNRLVVSNRGSLAAGEAVIPVQTFRSDGTTDFINEIGGADPTVEDYGSNPIATSANLSTLTTATTTAQSVTSITIGVSDIVGVDFGFNFDVVVNTNNSGQGSLRQFIHNSNDLENTNLNQEDNPNNGVAFPKDEGWETSIFMIPGGGLHQIQPITTLKSIQDSKTHITGYTQTGSTQGTLVGRTINIELIGNTTNFDALTIHTDSVQISGLAIYNFRKGIYNNISNSEYSFIWGNYIGTEADGITGISNNNVSSAIDFRGVTNSFIGTNGDNINDANEGNLISNSYYGLDLRNPSNIMVAGNYIGLDKTGTVDFGNRYNGLYIDNTTIPNFIGFKDDLPNSDANHFRNVISGNGNDAIRISNSNNQVIAGNYLGTDATGLVAIRNSNYGIQLLGSSSNNIIGTNSNGNHDLLERNILSGNGTGIRTLSGGTGLNNIIAGNYIGTDVTGNGALPNLTLGIDSNFDDSRIGTNGDGINDEVEGNVISGNTTDGIRLSSGNNAIISGNKIGVGADGTTQLGNGARGIIVATNTSNVIIGYAATMTNTDELIVGNEIKYNPVGIALSGTGTNNRISRNQISENDQLGIDLDYDGVTPNDNGDGDTGANMLLNFPVLDSAFLAGSQLTISGFAPADSEIEFFIADTGPNTNPWRTGQTVDFGEGAMYLFTASEGSDADSDATTGSYMNDGTWSVTSRTQNRFEFTFDVSDLGISGGTRISSTATDANNNTSEFSGVTSLFTNEICTNGIDDDGDGSIDHLDDDCDCPADGTQFANLDFINYIIETGTGLDEDDVIRYTNVGVVANQIVDIRATVIDNLNFTQLQQHSTEAANGLPDDASLRLPSVNVGMGTQYSTEILYEVFFSGTNAPVTGNFEVEISDIDDDFDRTETISLAQSDLAFYTLSSPTNISTSSSGDNIIFTGSVSQSVGQPEGTIKLSFLNSNSFSITYGSYQKSNGPVSPAGFTLDANDFNVFGTCGEQCDNGLDDDGDGLIDSEDSKCPCCLSKVPVLLTLRKK